MIHSFKTNLTKLFNSFAARLEGRNNSRTNVLKEEEARKGRGKGEEEGTYVLMEQGKDGKWRKGNITLEDRGTKGWKVTVEAREGREGKAEGAEGSAVTCYIPDMYLFDYFLTLLFQGKGVWYTSLREESSMLDKC